MFFNSVQYLMFLSLVAIVLYSIPGRFQWLWLLACSAVFYYILLPEYLIVFFVLIGFNYYLAIAIERIKKKRNTIFVCGICINIIVLAFFKYYGLFQSLFLRITIFGENNQLLKIILPVGLSFFIFTALSYIIEVKRGTIKAESHIGILASSLLFFPKIMQGPIERPGNIFSQFLEKRSFNYEMIVEGLKLMLWGYFKKLVIADRLAIFVNSAYNDSLNSNGTTLFLATICYSFQIYADFSGYTDIAIGSAKILGFSLTGNFNRPYFATSIKEFWNRWHISFSLWLRDYLFLPLAVLFTGKMKKAKYFGIPVAKWIFMLATLMTFAICGLWHGERLNFLIWGLLFGIYLTISNWALGLNKKIRKKLKLTTKSFFYRIYHILITFLLVSFTWIFFRANDIKTASTICLKIFTSPGKPSIDMATLAPAFFFLSILLLKEFNDEYLNHRFQFFNNKNIVIRYFSYLIILFSIILFGVSDGGQFIYFQF
jgi:alginate O-acetyltransferase complex protein AlgI